MEQRLAAVLAADMVGYSRLMEADERSTLERLRTHRAELIDPAITKNRGTIIKTTGDGMLVEFPSVVDAVLCAVEVQRRMKLRNSDVATDRRIQFRVGVNLGDIIFDEGDIYGDGVNIAARLEQLAEAGEVNVSSAVYEQVQGRVDVEFVELGEKILKNLSRPVRVYQAVLPAATASEPVKPRSEEPVAVIKPSIAVLPFANMSGDPDQEFFVDGLTEDILTELARRHELFVISRNSTFVYKGQSVNLRDVAAQLGAAYVVEGSVRKAGNRLRITAQLIEAQSDAHVWAERYDRDMDDIFAIQDEITSSIVATLPGRIEESQQSRLARQKPASLAAYECVLVAKVLHHQSTRETNLEAQQMIARAVALDPGYAHAHAWRGCIYGQAWGYGWCDNLEETLDLAQASILKAASLDDNDADVHRLLAALYILQNDLPRALRHQERSLELNPNYDLSVVQMGEVHTWLGNPETGIEWIRKAMRLNPHHPPRFWSHLGRAHHTARQYNEAIEAFSHLPTLETLQLAYLAACHAMEGDEVNASRYADRVRETSPDFTRESFLETMHFGQREDLDHLTDGLIRAGLA
ncbi:adenylate/guanylate cyclase domain-containing protein [Roseibium sp. Sym1]|uniref:adenylate/guanylate cyclase domain-containing protein n=1 Tax=Roseibium sp. Sym1 TaxID=3016006 RepID=UPI0022B4CE13|nr:adenylate/guanylate cyclase domain-containing protein [Roseibium sp. Sym1]